MAGTMRRPFNKFKKSDEEDTGRLSITSPKVEISSRVQSQGTFRDRCLRFVGLRNERSIKAPVAKIGAPVVANGPLGTSVQNERIAIFDMDRRNGSNTGTCRSHDVQRSH